MADERREPVDPAEVAKVLRPFLHRKESDRRFSADLEAEARTLGISRATAWRYLARLKASGGRLSALRPEKSGPKMGSRRLPEDREALLSDLIQKLYLVPERPSLARTVLEIRSEFKRRGWTAPTRRTVQRRIDQMDQRTVTRHREGAAAARQKFKPVPGEMTAKLPLDIVQIDHTQVDLILVDSIERKALDRPWVTLAIDVATRMVIGFYLSFHQPSGLSVAMCISQATQDKSRWLAAREIDAQWPVFGAPKSVHADNGKDFKSKALRKACQEWGIDLVHRPVGAPNYGGHIERLMGTMMGAVQELPGTTKSSIQQRGSYKSLKHAALTLDEFETWLTLEICRYHAARHSTLGVPPLQKWQDLEEARNVRMPPDIDAFRIDFLPEERRTIRRDGVFFKRIGYWSDTLGRFVGRLNEKVTIKYDPRNLSRIWVSVPSGEIIEARYKNLANPEISIWEHQTAKKRLAEKGNTAPREEEIMGFIREQRTIVDSAVKRTKQQRMERELRPASPQRKGEQATDGAQKMAPVNTAKNGPPKYHIEDWSSDD